MGRRQAIKCTGDNLMAHYSLYTLGNTGGRPVNIDRPALGKVAILHRLHDQTRGERWIEARVSSPKRQLQGCNGAHFAVVCSIMGTERKLVHQYVYKMIYLSFRTIGSIPTKTPLLNMYLTFLLDNDKVYK